MFTTKDAFMGLLRCFMPLVAVAVQLHAQPYVITTVAGGVTPPTPMPATAASVSPNAVAFHPSGTLYFSSRNAIYKVDTAGILTRVAGNSRAGFSGDEGPALEAQLRNPNGLAFDAAGNLYVADTGNDRVRRIAADGRIATVIESVGAMQLLRLPYGVAVDSAGKVFVSDRFGIHKLAPDGTVGTVAGCPVCGGDVVLAADSVGNVYAASPSGRAWRFNGGSDPIRIVGRMDGGGGYSGEGGPATEAILGRLAGIVVNANGEPCLADMVNGRVFRIAADGTIHTAVSGLSGPGGLASDGRGNLYVVEYGDWRVVSAADGSERVVGSRRWIRRIAADGSITTAVGNGTEEYSGDDGPAAAAQMNDPWGVAADGEGNVYVSDAASHVVRKISASGVITTVAGTGAGGYSGDGGPATRAMLDLPLGLAVDGSGNVYVADCRGARVRRVSAAGVITTVAGPEAQFRCPHGVAVDSSGVYVAESLGSRVRKIGADGTMVTVAGTGVSGFGGDGGPAASAQLSSPTSLAMDGDGNLYIADTGNNRIRKVSRDGTIQTIAGGTRTWGDGTYDGVRATEVMLGGPQGVAVDAVGNVYIADSYGNHIRRVSRSGIISTIAGRGLYQDLDPYDGDADVFRRGYSGDGGPGTSAELGGPYGIAVDAQFNVYFADSPNGAVRKLAPAPIANAASMLAGPIAAGEIVTLHGLGLGPATMTEGSGGTEVLFDGTAAQVLHSSDDQVAAVVPEIRGDTVRVEVRYAGKTRLSFTHAVARSAPGLFVADATGRGLARIVNEDGSANGLYNPARMGTVITLFATGDGLVGRPEARVRVAINGIAAEVVRVGAAQSGPGVTEIQVRVPRGVRTILAAAPVVLEVDGVASQPGVHLYAMGDWIRIGAAGTAGRPPKIAGGWIPAGHRETTW